MSDDPKSTAELEAGLISAALAWEEAKPHRYAAGLALEAAARAYRAACAPKGVRLADFVDFCEHTSCLSLPTVDEIREEAERRVETYMRFVAGRPFFQQRERAAKEDNTWTEELPEPETDEQRAALCRARLDRLLSEIKRLDQTGELWEK